MPVYSFRLLPDDGIDNAQFSFPEDAAALETARTTLRDVAVDAAIKGRPIPAGIEVTRDGTLITTIVADDIV